ncbi:hypothetical protein EG68_00891 [Paragonimus skrjabini miyazakii]|uniref:SCP domain-containing protein n=1 Tax=Paragonimus skrjabini miyazakii TaxID=59628 RepID=A0A8S9Z9D6_9TREM|nr:hypothetical protein EG68_00891 [Paragonimus skrjabini miyazakii]
MRASYAVFGLLLFITHSLQSRCRGPFRRWRKNILGKHNEFRTMALMGNISGQPTASDMPMLDWNTKLSRAARRWSKKCQMTYDLTIADGENLAYAMEKNADVVTGWFMRHSDFKFGPITEKSDRLVLQYTQIVWANTSKLGCYLRRCKKFTAGDKIIENACFTVCRYSPK